MEENTEKTMNDSRAKIIGIKKRTFVIIGIIFAVSLAFNLVTIGAMVAHKSWHKDYVAGNYDHDQIKRILIRQFPKEKEPQVQAILAKHRQNINDTYRLYTKHKIALVQALGQETIERIALENITADLRTVQHSISTVHHALMIDLSLISSHDLREIFIKSIMQRSPLTSPNHP